MAKAKLAKKAIKTNKKPEKNNKISDKKPVKAPTKAPLKATAKPATPAKTVAKPTAANLTKKPSNGNTAPASAAAPKKPGQSPMAGIKMIDSKSIMAKAQMKPAQTAKMAEPNFAANDFVVYPTHGVGLVKGVETQEIAGHKLKLFVIEIEGAKMTIKVPVNKANNVGLRRLSTRKEMNIALEKLKIKTRVRRTMWSRRAAEYEAKINSGDPIQIAEVVRELYRNSTQPDQSYSERQIYQNALERLSREVAAVDRINDVQAVEKIETILKAA
jgi:CarD family transcriptional regulator